MKSECRALNAAVVTAALFISTTGLSWAESEPIPLDQLGAVATKQVKGDSLSITATENGARLRCGFQRLEGEATPEGLWLSSTIEAAKGERFRLVAIGINRGSFQEADRRAELHDAPLSTLEWDLWNSSLRRVEQTLPSTGIVSVADQLIRFIRPGLTEEYSVSVDGVRQDFVALKRPTLSPAAGGEGALRVELALSGAKAEPSAYGAKLTLEGSGRTLAYSRLRATDATGRELTARMEVLTSNSESRKQKAETGLSFLTSAAAGARLAVLVDDADAVYPIRIDPTFSDADWVSLSSLPGTDGWVFAIAADDSGNLYIGGNFTVAGSVVANNIAKWDGNEWSALGSGVGEELTDAFSPVSALAVIGTDLYAGGEFTTAGGVTATHIAKWNGTSWSALGSGMDDSVLSFASIGTDLYAGGAFTTAGGVTVNHIAKWNGTTWSALGSGLNDSVLSLASIGTDLYAGGEFTTAGGATVNYVAKWNGSEWSALGSGMGGAFPGYGTSVNALAVSGTDLYVGGNFTSAGGISANHIARWNGSSWSPLGSGMGASYSYAPSVQALAVIGTDLYAGGKFNTAGGATVNYIAKWNGYWWSALGFGMGESRSDWVWSMAVVGSDLYVGGEFLAPSGVPANNIAKWDGSGWSALGSGIGGYSDLAGYSFVRVRALAVGETDLYVGGNFITAPGGVLANNIAKWDGDSWSALGSGVYGGGEGAGVAALALDGNDLYVGGYFSTAGGAPANNIAKWNGSTWSALGSGMNDWVLALAVNGSDLYAGGWFTTAGGVTANRIAKWNGSTWSALGSGMNHYVNALAVIGTDLYAGGWFNNAGGVAANGIAKWSGSTWSALGSGMLFEDGLGYPGEVYALAVMGTDLYAGGSFITAGGVPAHSIAKWDGSVWSALDSGPSSEPQWQQVFALAASGSDLYAGGYGYVDEWTGDLSVAGWNGSHWSALGSGPTGFRYHGGSIDALAADDSGHLFVGGWFLGVGNTVSPYIIQANITGLDFTWDPIPSPQEVDVPTSVTLTARNAAGEVRADFTDAVNLSGYAPGLATTNVSVGSGTTAWGYPLRTSYHDARTQVIYPASELGQACTLNSLALEVTTPPGQTLENWTIRMQHAALAEYPLSPSWEDSGWTVVYQSDEPAGTSGWRTFQFSTPFEYDGTNNLLIDFSFNNEFYSSEGQCRSSSTSAYRSITYASDSKDGDPLSWSGTSPTPVRSYNVLNLVLGTSYPDLLPVLLSPTVTTPFVNGVWTGKLTVQEAVTNLVLRADDGLGHEGESNPFDVQGVTQPPMIVTDDGQMGITNGFFGFNVQGQAGQVVVFEVSTNLVDWLPLQTNTLSGDPFYFRDPDTANFIQRFYRAVTR